MYYFLKNFFFLFKVPPRFRDSAFFDKGEDGVIKIPFEGNPKPRVVWQKDGETIESGARFEVKTEERHALLIIKDASKVDSGAYTITADNELGSDFALINVQISDRPDPPRWPQTSQIGKKYNLGVKIQNLKVNFKTGGTWRRVGQ